MNEQAKNPIEVLAESLAAMTARAMEAERQRDAALKDADTWFKNWQIKDEQLKEVEKKLEHETIEHKLTRASILEYISEQEKEENRKIAGAAAQNFLNDMKEGATDNDGNNQPGE